MAIPYRNFMHGTDEPGMIFAQKMLYNFESQITDRNVFVPSGSVLPGYRTKRKDFMDDEYHAAPVVFEFVAADGADRYTEMFAFSTVRPSEVALGGACHTSNLGEPALTMAEIADKDRLYVGDELCFIDLS